jgi:ABC-type multidrug transport system fused ATPase/permease subunit
MLNFLAAQRWLGLRIELLGATISFSVSTIIVCANGVLRLPAGLIGLGIQWSYVFTAALNFFFQRLSECEARITSIERVHETAKLPQEASWETDSSILLDPAWPTKGELEFVAVCMRYRKELPLALDSVSFTLRPGMRCGVVGRTGSGQAAHDCALAI